MNELSKKIEAYPFWFVKMMEKLFPQQEQIFNTMLKWEVTTDPNTGDQHRNVLAVNLNSIEDRWFNNVSELYKRYNKLRVYL